MTYDSLVYPYYYLDLMFFSHDLMQHKKFKNKMPGT